MTVAKTESAGTKIELISIKKEDVIMTVAEEKYQAELVKSERDHHTPTAGAMTGHIISNLVIQQHKLRQTLYYAKGIERDFITRRFPALLAEEGKLVDRLNRLMLDEGEVIPTTSEEFSRYSMLEESGQAKYEAADALIFAAVKDFATQNLFISRGIALAEKEQKYALAAFLKELYGWLKQQIFCLQSFLGNEAADGLTEEEDED